MYLPYSRLRWTTQSPRNPVAAGDHQLQEPVRPAPPPDLVDAWIWLRMVRPIDLMMDLALGRPALAVVTSAPTSKANLLRTAPTTITTRMSFSIPSRPPSNL